MNKPLLVAALSALALASGCGRDEARTVVSNKDVKVTAAGGNASVALPDTFPKDVPIISGGSVKSVINTPSVTTVMLTAGASPQEAAKYYQESLSGQGWKIDHTLAQGNVTMITAAKDKRQVSLQIGTSDDKTSAIMISLRAKD